MTRKASPAIRAALKDFDPSDEQWDAIEADLEPIAIVAGAGSGKTAVMTARIVYLIEKGLARPAEVLGLTFTNKAAAALESRLASALAQLATYRSEHPTVLTYHAFAAQLVREHGPRIGIDSDAGLLSGAQKWQMLMKVGNDFPKFEHLELRHPLSFIPQTLALAEQCAQHIVTPEQLEQECARIIAEERIGDRRSRESIEKRGEFATIIRKYIDEKRKTRRIDYGDQIALAVRILEEFPDVRAELRKRHAVVLLDEYQDTDPAQKKMLQQLCPPGWPVTAVGDARQAIYGFRGASMFNLLHFDEEFPRADGSPSRILSLKDNYRSGRRIVELANTIIEKVPEERRRGDELSPVERCGDGWVGAALFADQETEATYIADEINRLHAEGLVWQECAVLLRTRRYLDRIVDAFTRLDIPFEIPEVGGLLKIPAVTDVVAWLRVLADRGPEANRWLARILMGPRYRVHYGDLAPIAKWASHNNRELTDELRELLGVEDADPGEAGFSLLEGVEHAHEIENVSVQARGRIASFLATLGDLRPLTGRPLADLVQAVAARTGLLDTLAASPTRSAKAMLANLHSFFAMCAEFSPIEGEPTLGTFLEYLDAAEESEDAIPLGATSTSESVKVMTVHGAKGLEFDVVFVPVLAASQTINRFDGMKQWSVFPDTRLADPMSSTKQLPYGVRSDAEYLPRLRTTKVAYFTELKQRAEEDERRLFYVAVTRARHRLYLTAAHWYQPEELKGPSVFMEEVLAQRDGPVEIMREDEAPESSPLVEEMRRALVWPPDPARVDDETMEWIERVERMRDGSLDEAAVLTEFGGADRLEEHARVLGALLAEDAAPMTAGRAPASLAATRAVELASGKERLEALLHPLPEPPTDARRLGVEVHAWIEERGRGLIGLAEEDALDEASIQPDRAKVAAMREAFVALGFDGRELARLDSGEPMTELPFTLKTGKVLVRGRIDAVYRDGEGLEVVDFKTGAMPDEPDRGQLELYAEALRELGLVTGAVRLTYAYLGTGLTHSWTYEPSGIADFEERLMKALSSSS